VVDIPIIVCNAPGLTASDVSIGTFERFAALPGIIGVEDCTGDLSRLGLLPQSARSRLRHYSGDDRTCLPFNLMGGSGTFSTVANITPRLMSSLHAALRLGDLRSAHSLHVRLEPVFDLLKRDTPTAVIKRALQALHGLNAETRLPLAPVDVPTPQAIEDLLETLPRNIGLSATL
jgi:4-hydroxy-tetrahydrodipicolinate synthase